ncbi:hypothetical protein V6N13_039870 [Hibiscus sabdariffa]
MVVERRQRKPLNKQDNSNKDMSGMIFQGSRFNLLRVSEKTVGDALPVPTKPLAEVPIQQVRSATSIPQVKPRNKGISTTTLKPSKPITLYLFPKDSTSLQQSGHNSPIGDPPDIPAPTSLFPSHRVSGDINMQSKQIDEAYDALDLAQVVAMLK